MSTPAEGLAALRAAAADGRLDELCTRHGVRLLTVFGSAARREPTARDLDVAVLPEPGSTLDVLALLGDLVDLTGTDAVDLARLDRATPLLQERALVGCIPLFESVAGVYPAAQTAAIGQRIDTDHFRRLDLALLADLSPRELDWRPLQTKLRLMRSLLDRLAALGPVDRARLDAEPVISLAVERVLTQLVELAFGVNGHLAVARLGRAPGSYAESFDLAAETGSITPELAASLRPSAGLRNVLVHNYAELDQQVVVAAVSLAIEQYGAYVRQVAASAERESRDGT